MSFDDLFVTGVVAAMTIFMLVLAGVSLLTRG